ncbi:MAG: methionyl-tRNA formyltransferase [Acidobacteriaceae bacterium]|nr:methionyl-tRNA formyltransferase [Acidobacteriaceae bacterium]
MRIVFLGTPEFAVPSLKTLVVAGHDVRAVFTQPDRPKGRGNQLAQSPVKAAAIGLGIDVQQPERIRRPENVELLRSLRAELMVVVGYGQIIPQTIIDLPAHGILNVHASLLPKYRGAAPIQWAIANGETETGVTIMQIDAGLDTGDMLLKGTLAIGPDETAPELSGRLAPLGAALLIEAIKALENRTVRREKQNNAEATHAPILKKEDGRIDWSQTAHAIYDRFRGFQPWPGAYTTFRGQQLTITQAALPEKDVRLLDAGALYSENRRLLAGCGDGTALELKEVQLAGKRRMPAEAFLNGYKLSQDERLGVNQ